jgi:hypothetical protein
LKNDQPSGKPVLRVISGDATSEEIAAIVAVLMSRAAADDALAAPQPARSAWADRSRALRRPLFPSPGGWRRSALPE